MDSNEIQLTFMTKSFTECTDALKKLTSQVDQTSKAVSKLENASSKFGEKASKGVKDTNNEMDKLGKKTSSAIKQMEGFGNVATTLRSMVGTIKRLGTALMGAIDPAIDYSEELNLFNVVFKNNMTDAKTEFSEVGLEAEKFQQTLHEAFGTNLIETRRFQALYQSMGENMGIVTEKAEILSSNLTKLTYDIASLYNASEKDVGNALKAGIYAGQTKPLRQYGIDVTQTSMQPIMNELGLEKSISELSQAEKQILRYISVLRQSSVAHGDFANTIESPANQLKILKQQCMEARVALGNLFIGAFSKILPYANAILMVIKEVAKAIAGLFGIEVEDFNSGIAVAVDAYDDLEDGIDGIGSSAGNASKAVKELKRQVLGFDQINNLTTPTPTSGSSGGGASGGVSGGIDQRLLDAINGYANGMDKVRMKATEIRDKILEWLGLEKQIDPITGEISWKFADTNSTLYKIVMAIKDIIKYGIKLIKDVLTIIKKDFDNGMFGKALVWFFESLAKIIKFIAEHKGVEQVIAKFAEAFLLFKTAKLFLKPFLTPFEKFSGLLNKFTGGKLAKAKVKEVGEMTKEMKSSFNVPNPKTIIKGMEDLAIIVGGLVTIVTAIGLLTKIPYFNDFANGGIDLVVRTFKGIAQILIPLAGVGTGVVALGKLASPKTVALGLADMAIIIAGTEAVILAVGALNSLGGLVDKGIETVIKTFKGITEICVPLVGMSLGMALAGLFGGTGVASMALGLADLAIVIAGTEVVVASAGAIDKIAGKFISSGLDTIKKIFTGIGEVGGTIALLSAGLLVAGLLGGTGAGAIIVGLADLALVIDGLSVVIAVTGAINSIPGFNWLVGKGIDLLNKLAKGLGELAGNIVKGFTGVAFDNLGEIGTKLSEFGENASPFFKQMKNVDEGVTQSIKNLASAILAFTSAGVLDALTSWFAGSIDIVQFGKQLKDFAPYFVEYADIVKDVDASVVTATSSAVKTLAEFACDLPNEGGLLSWIVGDNKLGDFSKYLPTFGKNIKKYADNIAGIDTGVIKNTTNAVNAVVEMAKEVPNEGGLLAWLVGDNKLSDFSKYLPEFGTNMKKYSKNIAGMDLQVVDNTTKASKSIVEMAKIIPNSGGMVSWFTGDNKLSDFGTDLAKFGSEFKKYYNSIKSISLTKINDVTSGVKEIINQFKKVKDNGLNETMSSFGTNLKNAGNGIKDFFSNSLTWNKGQEIGYNFGKGMASGIKSGIKNNFSLNLKVTSEGQTVKNYKVQTYASGGIPTKGTMFTAGEAGPEIVGHINGQTEVLNQSQLASVMYEAVSKAISNSDFASGIELYAHTDEGVVIDKINKITRQTGQCPLEV